MGIRRQHKALGVVFLCLLLGGVWLTYGVFTKKFTDYAEVTLKTSKIGLQLPMRADVKTRGVLVGEVLPSTPTPRARCSPSGSIPTSWTPSRPT